MSADVEAARLDSDLDGRRVGTAHGSVVCDLCNRTVDLARPAGDRRELDDPHSETFTGYATKRGASWQLLKVYCEECDEREIEAGTHGYHEAMIAVEVEFIGLTSPPCMVIGTDVLDYSGPDDGAPP